MDMNTYRERLCRPIAGDNPAGQRLVEDSLLDFIDDQMMKVGTLAHKEIQWQETEQAALTLLETKTKDIKLLGSLLQCIQYQPHPERFILSLQVLADFIAQYWECCYPAPGDRGILPRRRFFTQILQRTATAAGRLDAGRMNSDWQTELESAIARLRAVAIDNSLPEDGVDEVMSALRPVLSRARVQPPASAGVPVTEGASCVAATMPITASVTVPPIDAGNDRTLKQSLLKVADVLSELNDGIGLSLRLRRFAVWYGITAAPDADDRGETPLMPVSADRIAEYEEQLRRGADHALWRRVEQSLSVAPYWLDGHFLSFRIAEALGNTAWAEAVAGETRAFVARLPVIAGMSFRGGVPFANSDTRHWLDAEAATASSAQSGGDWDCRRREAFELAEAGGLSVAMAMLNDGLKAAKEPRDQFYWRLLTADIMQHHKLSAFSSEQYRSLLAQAESTALTDWEPSLIQQLTSLATTD